VRSKTRTGGDLISDSVGLEYSHIRQRCESVHKMHF